jgi:signal peptidase I
MQQRRPKTEMPVAGARRYMPYDFWEEVLQRHATLWCRIGSDSMHPVLCRGDMVLIRTPGTEGIAWGDIAVFKKQGTWVIHRIIGRRQENGRLYFLEKGDANPDGSYIEDSCIIGTVQRIRGRYGTIDTGHWPGKVSLLVPAVISLFSLKLATAWRRFVRNGRYPSPSTGRNDACNRLLTPVTVTAVRLFSRNERIPEKPGGAEEPAL